MSNILKDCLLILKCSNLIIVKKMSYELLNTIRVRVETEKINRKKSMKAITGLQKSTGCYKAKNNKYAVNRNFLRNFRLDTK
jgi:hypothetical protein